MPLGLLLEQVVQEAPGEPDIAGLEDAARRTVERISETKEAARQIKYRIDHA